MSPEPQEDPNCSETKVDVATIKATYVVYIVATSSSFLNHRYNFSIASKDRAIRSS